MKKTISLVLTSCIACTTACAEVKPANNEHYRYDLIPKGFAPSPTPAKQALSNAPLFEEPDVTVLMTLTGEQATDGFGWVAEDLGDINGDGAGDFIVTAPFFSTNVPFPAGKIYVYSGADGSILNSVTSPGVPVWGYSAKGAGDVDGDGTTDYIVGSFSSVMVFSGATHAVLHQWFKAGEFFGSSVTGAGDLNNDGFGDVIVGARYAGNKKASRGKVYAYSGKDGKLLWKRKGKAAGDQLGTATGAIGDVNNDGVPDVVVGARGVGDNEQGRAFILSGHNGHILRKLKPKGEPGLVTDGAGVTAGTFGLFHGFGVGDVNGDGIDDAYVGDYNAQTETVNGSGRGFLFSGATGKRLHIFDSENTGDGFGPARGVGDVNHDGHNDLFIAAYTYTGGSNAGKGYLYSGKDFTVLKTFTGTTANQFLGVDALGISDINNDGIDELMLTGSGILHIIAGAKH
ncbi:FG-GAP-like repeat-containing protein [Pleionea sp. CnH1-48]|uniref:FG-GAP-like repeat-containing protein n=1 Tax=Pleionea sp. CnH1-48 TaxID=2954494 RepID=UPI002097F95A|nr:FG-GAP-like repeat-containing protein [Pleionea sp. CnH1-48]MCO7224207.1 FG-GAP-like repeat-containing protein [Pleionea sp. CnH1-48]